MIRKSERLNWDFGKESWTVDAKERLKHTTTDTVSMWNTVRMEKSSVAHPNLNSLDSVDNKSLI